ncbi:MAG: hypothetical protein J3Q66DRAFT_375936 [Benniella sp.]|nr:MAG: hypothetical protein J3Q66DRAFT_375936 [Benniella sp.]
MSTSLFLSFPPHQHSASFPIPHSCRLSPEIKTCVAEPKYSCGLLVFAALKRWIEFSHLVRLQCSVLDNKDLPNYYFRRQYLAVFRFVLVSAAGACFAIYAEYGGEYAKSIGWIQIQDIAGWRKNVPESVKWALVAALLATLAASFLDKEISHFINPASSLGPPTTDIKSSSHTRPNSIKSFYGWSFIVSVNGSAADTMTMVLNSSFVIRDLDVGQRYTPITSTYNPACTDFGIVFADQTFWKDANGCGTTASMRQSFVRTNFVNESDDLLLAMKETVKDHQCHVHPGRQFNAKTALR